MDTQFVEVGSQLTTENAIPVGIIVKSTLKSDIKICIITKEHLKEDGSQGYQVRPLNILTHSIVNEPSIEVIPSDPSYISTSSQNLDPYVMKTCLIEEDLHRLWNYTIDDTVSKENRLI